MSDLPPWLQPRPYFDLTRVAGDLTARQMRREIEEHTFESLFEDALDTIAMGNPLTSVVEDDPRPINYARMLAWIHRDPKRQEMYYAAQAIGAQAVERDMLAIADAKDSIEDVNRSTLRINTRKWLLGVWNRKRFGDVKQIEQNVNIDLSQAMQEAQARLDKGRTIDVIGRVVDGDD
jgi:hypothetical protein